MKTILIAIIFGIMIFSFIFYPDAYAVSFIDHLGYLPNWTSTMGPAQTISVCSTNQKVGTDDFKWCGEFAGYTIDQASGITTVTFRDHTGYIPSWTSTMGPAQALSVCSTNQKVGTDDFKWCGEFAGYIIDQARTSTIGTSTQSTVPEFGSLVEMIILISIVGSVIISKRFFFQVVK